MLAAERDGWILMAARWPERIQAWLPGKFAHLEDARVVRLHQLLSQLMADRGSGDAPVREAVDIMVELAEYAEAAGEVYPDGAGDDTFSTLLDELAEALGDRAEQMRELLRRRGWDGWSRMRRVPQSPG